MPPNRCVSIVSLIVVYHVLTRHTVAEVSKDQDRPNDPLSLSTQQSRLIRQTWTAAGIVGRSSDGETQAAPRPKYHRNRRGGATARPDSTNTTSPSTVSSTDKSMFFEQLYNIEKVCKTVDERMQKRKVQKEWSKKIISETARLRGDSEEGPKENLNTNMHGERTPSNDNADIAQVDALYDDNDLLLGRLGTPQTDDRDPESMEEVPTSQSQERYLSPSHLSQMFPMGSLAASCAPINGNHLAVLLTSEMSSGPASDAVRSH